MYVLIDNQKMGDPRAHEKVTGKKILDFLTKSWNLLAHYSRIKTIAFEWSQSMGLRLMKDQSRIDI